jgi:hypothetical protein
MKITPEQFESFLELLAQDGVPLSVDNEIGGSNIKVNYKHTVFEINPEGFIVSQKISSL